MSRAFINKGEQWGFCSKAADHCMYAEDGKDCRRTECEFYDKAPEKLVQRRDKVVRRKKAADPAKNGSTGAGNTGKTRSMGRNESAGNIGTANRSGGSPVKTKKAAILTATNPAMRRRQLQALREHAKKMADDEIE